MGGSRLEWIAGAAHWVMEEKPDVVADRIVSFLAEPTTFGHEKKDGA
ncbi:pimeloyl-ACP methyl ester carboxylesterase [Roseovarius sp. MBR-154]|jgi:pimeloyl-ACP methyl ester carboxylesterase